MQIDRRGFLGGTAAAALVAGSGLPVLARTAISIPPPLTARIEPVTETFFGQSVTDPYRWMETRTDPDWEPFMRSNAAHAEATLAAIPGRAAMLEQISALTGSNASATAPIPAGGKLFYTRRDEGKDTSALFVREGTIDHVLVDPDALKVGDSHVSLDWWVPSPDGSHVVYGLSPSGSEDSVLHIMRVADQTILPERIDRTQYALPSWLPDGSGFFYLRFGDAAKGTVEYYNDSVAWLHRIGTEAEADIEIIKRGKYDSIPLTPSEFPAVIADPSSDHALVFVFGGVRRENPCWSTPLAELLAGTPRWKPVATLEDEITGFGWKGDDLYLLTTRDAENGKILKTSLSSPDLATAATVVPHSERIVEALTHASDGLYVGFMDGGYQTLGKLEPSGALNPVTLPFDGAIQQANASTSEPGVFLRLTSWLEPFGVWQVRADGSVTDTGLSPKPAIDTSPFEAIRDFATARDGTRVPVSIIAKKGLVRDGSAPTLVNAYGAYQVSSTPFFATRAVPFLALGGVLVTAHVRGGGEYGKRWWRAGQKLTKPNTWRDLIDVSEHLIRTGWTSPSKLGINGGSAGGITVGRALTERPDLFAVAVPEVGCLNALRMEFSQNGPANIDEFGTVTTEDGFKGLYAMDSLHHVVDGIRYPAVLMTHGMTDPRVEPWHSAKMTARLRAAAAPDSGPIVLRVDFEAGHGIGSTRSQIDSLDADIYSFLLWQTGQAGFQPV